ncbi:MAG: hypothetical protein ABEK50_00400 [bacterium]
MSFKDLYDPDFQPRGSGDTESSKYWYPIDRNKRESEVRWFLNHYDLLNKYRERILEDPELYGVPVKSGGVDTTVAVPSNLNLGPVLVLWRKGEFRRPCPDCEQSAHVLYAGGSPLSGSHSWSGFCRNENKPVSKSKSRNLLELYKPLSKFLKARKSGELVDSGLDLEDVIPALEQS